MLIFLRFVYVLICAGAAAALVQNPMAPEIIKNYTAVSFIVMMLATQIVTFVDILIPRKRLDMISAIFFGLLVGWLLAFQLLPIIFTVFLSFTDYKANSEFAPGNFNFAGLDNYQRLLSDPIALPANRKTRPVATATATTARIARRSTARE